MLTKHTIMITGICTYMFSLGPLCTLMPMLSNLTLTEIKSHHFKHKQYLKPGINILIMNDGE